MTAKKILIVEDDAIIARDIRTTLGDLGYTVSATVASGEAAIEAVAAHKPDLVLMDVRIQGERDGIQTAATIRAEHAIPVVYLTSHSDDITIYRAKETGAYGYVLKPFTDRDLKTAIEVALEKREIEQRLSERERWFATTLNSIADAVIAVDTAGAITFLNPAAEALTGLQTRQAVGRALGADLFGLYASEGDQPVAQSEHPIQRALSGETVLQVSAFVRAAGARGGQWHSINASPVRDVDGTLRGAVTVSRDVTDLRRAMEQLERAAVRDELTGLLNRRGFQGQAALALALANRSLRPFALVYIDLNGMKTINDQLGHAAGDRALGEAAELIRRTFRASDVLARLGGDEFAVLATDYNQDVDGDNIQVRFRKQLLALRAEKDRPYELSASVGVTVYDPRRASRTLEQLLADADAKMYEAKQRRKVEGTQRLEKL